MEMSNTWRQPIDRNRTASDADMPENNRVTIVTETLAERINRPGQSDRRNQVARPRVQLDVKRAFGAAGLLLTARLMLAGCNGNVAHGTVAGTLESEGGQHRDRLSRCPVTS